MALFDQPSRDILPEADFEDVKYTAGKALVSLVPGLSDAWGLMIAAPLDKRRNDWLRDLELRLRELEDRVTGFHFENLSDNKQFVSATVQATQSALRTHQQDKLDALKNAVVNVALGKEQDADRQQQFLAMADRFSQTHLTILRLFNAPAEYFLAKGKPVPTIRSPRMEPVIKLLAYQLVADAMPELLEQVKSPKADHTGASFQFIESVFGDLVSAKLVWLERHQETWGVPKLDNQPAPTPVGKLTTHLGDDFLAFITDQAS